MVALCKGKCSSNRQKVIYAGAAAQRHGGSRSYPCSGTCAGTGRAKAKKMEQKVDKKIEQKLGQELKKLFKTK